jgi:hypothetical protein
MTRREIALAAAQSVQLDLPGAFSSEHDQDVAAYVSGEISASELYGKTVSRYRKEARWTRSLTSR